MNHLFPNHTQLDSEALVVLSGLGSIHSHLGTMHGVGAASKQQMLVEFDPEYGSACRTTVVEPHRLRPTRFLDRTAVQQIVRCSWYMQSSDKSSGEV